MTSNVPCDATLLSYAQRARRPDFNTFSDHCITTTTHPARPQTSTQRTYSVTQSAEERQSYNPSSRIPVAVSDVILRAEYHVAGDSDGDDVFGGDESGVFEQMALIEHHMNGLFGFELGNKQVVMLFDICHPQFRHAAGRQRSRRFDNDISVGRSETHIDTLKHDQISVLR
jgi:hypothetical protein